MRSLWRAWYQEQFEKLVEIVTVKFILVFFFGFKLSFEVYRTRKPEWKRFEPDDEFDI